jgi:tRNA(fMet)-specific endonuclease VapC
MKTILVDTSAYGRLLSGDKRILDPLSTAETVFFSVVVMGELMAGFRGGSKYRENRSELSGFLQKPTVKSLDVSSETAEIFAQVKHALRLAGNPIPINDIWIASQVLETGSVLVTFDEHFRKVAGLRIWDLDG